MTSYCKYAGTIITSLLQFGQTAFEANQGSMQSEWKEWVQGNTLPLEGMVSRQMEQVPEPERGREAIWEGERGKGRSNGSRRVRGMER